MKKNYFIALLALVCNFAMAQIQQTSYKGAFAPAPTAMWTAGWTNFDPNNASYGVTTVQVSADVTSNTTWTANNVYQLNGLINVRNNATLTIQPGTVIRSSLVASALVITRGAKLIANGTAAAPIVFTSNKDAGSRLRGDWGGIVILGRARYNINNGVNFIEGLTQTVLSEFGGGTTPDDNDNSGILRYVRIEFAGFVFSPNNELNGLTMGAVGKGTTIENVQVSYSNDDSFEWFGGSVNCKNLVAFAGLDDDFDVDSGFKGVVQFGLSIKDPAAADISTSEIFEVDNNATGAETTTAQLAYGDFTSPIFSNITCVGPNARPGVAAPAALHDKALRLRRASRANIYNSIFLDSRRGLSIESVSSNTAYNATTPTAIFKNNTIASPIPLVLDVTPFAGAAGANAATQTWFNASTNVAITTGSAGILTRPYNATSATNYNLITDNIDATGIDYRPASVDARTAASFTDTKLSGLLVIGDAPGVTPTINYCRGVVAPALTANFTETGVSLQWYTKDRNFKFSALGPNVTPGVLDTKDTIVNNLDGTQTITVNGTPDVLVQNVDVFTTTATIPATTVVGTKYFYVAEVNASGAVSNRAQIRVNVAPSPTVALGTITGPTVIGSLGTPVPVTNFGSYVGTTTTATFTVPASTENVLGVPVVTSYFWTLPLGVNLISGQGTNTIVVNFANVPGGVLKIGNIGVQARNAELCGGALKTLAIAATLPAAPRLVMNDPAVPPRMVTVGTVTTSTPVAVTSFARYMGTTTPLNLVATAVIAPSSYVWELPTGVNILPVGSSTTTTVFYNLYPFIGSGLSSAPTGAGNVFYSITTVAYTDGTRIQTGRIRRNARAATAGVGGLPAITAFDNPLTNLTNEGVVVSPAYPITSSTSNVISVNFNGVTSANTFAYDIVNATTGAITPTYVVRIGVRSRNGVGASVTSNAAAVNPPTSSTAVQLRLTAVRPAAPSVIKMTNDVVSTVTAVTVISKFVGTNTPFTLTATPSVLSSSYTWELPAGVNLVSLPSSLSTNVISVDFAGVVPGTTSLYIGVKAVNGIGVSVTSNTLLTPATSSSAKLLKLTATLPAAVSVVAGQIAGVCGNSAYNYTMTASLLANSYVITAPAGSVVTSASNLTNTSNVLATSDLIFTVTYPAGFVATTAAPKSIVISSVNGVGSSLLNKTIALSTLMPAIGVVTGSLAYNSLSGDQIYTVTPVIGATQYVVTLPLGAVLVSQALNVITANYSAVTTATSTLKVVAINACGVSSAIRSIPLSLTTPVARIASNNQEIITVTATEVYPNPSTNVFNIDITASIAGSVQVNVFTFDGNMVSSKSIQLQEGNNTITEDISSLNNGIYFVQIANSSNNEVIVKKMIKQ